MKTTFYLLFTYFLVLLMATSEIHAQASWSCKVAMKLYNKNGQQVTGDDMKKGDYEIQFVHGGTYPDYFIWDTLNSFFYLHIGTIAPSSPLLLINNIEQDTSVYELECSSRAYYHPTVLIIPNTFQLSGIVNFSECENGKTFLLANHEEQYFEWTFNYIPPKHEARMMQWSRKRIADGYFKKVPFPIKKRGRY